MRSEAPVGWTAARLGEQVDLLVGFAFKSADFTNDPDGIRLLRGDNVGQGRLRWNGARRWPVERSSEFERYELRPRDIVLAMDRPWIDAGLKYAMVRDDDVPCLLVQRVARLRGTDTLSQEYLRYLIASPEFTSWVQAVQTGTAVPHISGGQIADYPFSLPPRPEQERIASVLAALDDKLDSNRRAARLLEQIAQTEFQARFVDFIGFDRLVDSPLGPLPGGWRVGMLADLADLHKDQIKPAETPDALFEHFSIPAFDAGNGPSMEPGRAILSAKTTVPGPECVLVSKLNPATKRVWWPQPGSADAAVCSPEFLVLMPRANIPPSYLYAVTSSDHRFYRELLSHVAGTTGSRQRVKPAAAMSCRVILPTRAALDRWDSVLRPLYDHAHSLTAESRRLGQLRDTLLPKLICGEIRVPDTANLDDVIEPLVDEAA